MTEAAFQAARKVMQSANYRRGIITACKGAVAKWNAMEMSLREQLKHDQAEGCKKQLQKAMKRLEEARANFAALTFPDPNLTAEISRCKSCGAILPPGHVYCDNDECMC